MCAAPLSPRWSSSTGTIEIMTLVFMQGSIHLKFKVQGYSTLWSYQLVKYKKLLITAASCGYCRCGAPQCCNAAELLMYPQVGCCSCNAIKHTHSQKVAATAADSAEFNIHIHILTRRWVSNTLTACEVQEPGLMNSLVPHRYHCPFICCRKRKKKSVPWARSWLHEPGRGLKCADNFCAVAVAQRRWINPPEAPSSSRRLLYRELLLSEQEHKQCRRPHSRKRVRWRGSTNN